MNSSPSPPAYSATKAPVYSAEPRANETLLAVTRSRRGRQSPPTRTFTWSNASITLSILGKEEGLDNPVYGQNGQIRAEVALEDPSAVVSVTVYLEGILQVVVGRTTHDTSAVEAFSEPISFLNRTQDLWQKPDELSSTPRTQCPSILLYEETLPSSYQDGAWTYELPPTFSASTLDIQGFSVDLKYTVTVCVARRRQSRFRKSDMREELKVTVIHKPRSRAYRPVLANPFPFSSTIKAVPEEWRQVPSKMLTYARAQAQNVEPIDCLLFIPSVKIYSLTEDIPVFLQLRGRVSSIRAFMHAPSNSSSLSTLLRKQRTPAKPPAQPIVRIYISRQITAAARGYSIQRSFTIGEATLRSLPPDAELADHPYDGFASLEYEGELRCAENVTVGSFAMGQLSVKDSIVVQLVPPDPVNSPLKEHEFSHPIRLVTDPFVEELDSLL